MDRYEEISRRFDRSQERLVLQQSDLSLETLHRLVAGNSIDLQPNYQRRERWNRVQQSLLFESFLLNVPIPPVYFNEDEYGQYSIIDGKQRLTAIHDYLSNSFALEGLEQFPEANGLYFEQLPHNIRNALSVRPYIRAITLLRQSDPEVKHEVFYRLNTGGVKLTAQEIRNVAFRGPFNDQLVELSRDPVFSRRLGVLSETGEIDTRVRTYKEMLDVELVLRFFTLRESWSHFSGSLRNSMDLYMRRNSQDKNVGNAGDFLNAVHTCNELWQDRAFARPVDGNWRKQFVVGIYDAQMIAVDALGLTPGLVKADAPEAALKAMSQLFEDAEFVKASTVATNTPTNVKRRIDAVIYALRKALL